jgi:hypothetical protein
VDRVVWPDDDPKNISLAAPFKAFMYLRRELGKKELAVSHPELAV